MQTRRLNSSDRDLARELFALMADVFEEESRSLSPRYLDRLLSRHEFCAIAAFVGDTLAGGLTAHTLSMTRSESSEIFIYDIAVRSDFRRRGVGRALIASLREIAASEGIGEVFVPAETADEEALEFYRALGGREVPVSIFTFSDDE